MEISRYLKKPESSQYSSSLLFILFVCTVDVKKSIE